MEVSENGDIQPEIPGKMVKEWRGNGFSSLRKYRCNDARKQRAI
jgi:hypothetical protein